ncbi:MAG: zf-TFIIB domain-containing protein [Candidatus Paceibacterota bacterium]|jgi:Zn-finger nucleic acid-binding protein
MENAGTNPKCPDCGKDLHEVAAEGQYGIKIRLDQCFDCGGIWFDSLELYPLPKEEIEKIENLKLDKLQENSFLGNGKKACPKCGIGLERLKDFNFPEELEVEQCKKCGGIWMNRGEAMEFKKWQEEKKKSIENPSKKDQEFNDNIKELLELYRDKDMEMVEKAGRILSMKLDSRTMRPLNEADYGTDEYNKAYNAASAAINVLYMLLRLFLR